MARVQAPVDGFEGVVADVVFHKGKAETSDARALAYFRRKGYIVDGEQRTDVVSSPDPRELGGGTGVEPVGTRLRDASVDPRKRDFLPPTNAGEANPHGPAVVAPGIHAVPPAPIVPGQVSDSAKEQEAIETMAAEQVLVAGMPVHEATAALAAEQGVDTQPASVEAEPATTPAPEPEPAKKTAPAKKAAPRKAAGSKKTTAKKAAPAKAPASKKRT